MNHYLEGEEDKEGTGERIVLAKGSDGAEPPSNIANVNVFEGYRLWAAVESGCRKYTIAVVVD